MKKLILILIIVLGALCPLYSASIDDWNGVDWATKADDFNGVDVVTKVSTMNGVDASSAPTNYVTLSRACWSYDNDLTDSSGNGNDLTLSYGTAAYATDYAQLGTHTNNQATAWEAVRATADLSANYPGKATTTALTVIARWRTPSSVPASGYLYSGGFSGIYRLVQTTGGKPQFYLGTGGENIVATSGLSANTVYVITGIWTGTQLKLYVNKDSAADPVSSTTIGSGAAAQAWPVYTLNGATPLGGHIDYVAVFDYALSESDIASIVDHGLDGSE